MESYYYGYLRSPNIETGIAVASVTLLAVRCSKSRNVRPDFYFYFPMNPPNMKQTFLCFCNITGSTFQRFQLVRLVLFLFLPIDFSECNSILHHTLDIQLHTTIV